MELLKDVGTAVGVFLSVVGVAGGLLTVLEKGKAYLLDRRPVGDRGATWCGISKVDTATTTAVEGLVGGDIFHFLTAVAKPSAGIKILSVDGVGATYRVKMSGPKGVFEGMTIVQKSS